MYNSQLDVTAADILVVDDSQDTLELLAALLRRRDYTVRLADNGEDAIESVKQCRPDLILLDVMMPGMDGIEVCRQLKSDAGTRDIPIIFISALNDIHDKLRAFEAGGVDYIIKPFEEKEVIVRVNTHLSLAHARELLKDLTDDLTRQRAAERVSNEERLAMVLEGSQQGYWDWNIETGEVQRNQRWAEMLGYSSISEFDANTNTWTDNIHPDDREAAWAAINDHLEGRSPVYKLEYRMLTKNGGIRWTLDQAKIVKRDANGRPVRMCGTHTDITEHKQAQAEKERLLRQLQQTQKMETIGQLTGGIAHDFNNILAAILGYTELSISHFATDPETKLSQYLHQILSAGERGRDLVDAMLAFARSSPGELQAVDGVSIIYEVTRLLLATLPASLSININLADDVPPLQADPVQLHQVLTNLIVNAYHAIGERGNISLGHSGPDTYEGVCSSCHQQFSGEFIEISVRDDGQGVPKDCLDKIFEPFFTTQPVGKGSGMGLPMVHGIVHSCGGHVQVDTEQGVGSNFRLFFPPALTDIVDASVNTVTLTTSAVENKCIMLVDDETGITGYLSELLGSLGYQVRAFNDPLAALEAFKSDPASIHLVVTDQTMPNLSGVEFTRELLSLKPGLPVILCTGYSETLDEKIAQQLGVSVFMKKPVARDDLLSSIGRLLT
ncbi:MAG: response regulator [Gammaproteobacteria bacterium]|nr:response regulator [Gammaproteobacteria bacterium]